jgi:hypothetical protein
MDIDKRSSLQLYMTNYISKKFYFVGDLKVLIHISISLANQGPVS